MDNGQLNGFYLGIVISNMDPEKRGRIKVFVPHLSVSLYDKINKLNQDMVFKFPGVEGDNLNNIMQDLKEILPWAEFASTPFGGSASGRYNAINNKGTTSDSNVWENGQLKETGRPLQNFVGPYSQPDAFSQTQVNNNRFTNPYSYQYTPSDYSNLARGTFSVPNVGAHVWIFFQQGDPNYPVYFAVSHGQEDFKRIYTMNKDVDANGTVDYPGSYENKTAADGATLNNDTQTFRAKHVINTNKHTIELVDTDKREILKMTHFSGSFLEFNNFATIQLATNNEQKMILGDQFLTVRRRQNIYVAQEQDLIIKGDQFTTIGGVKQDTVNQIYQIMKRIHAVKWLFDIQRAQRGETPNLVAPGQERVGIFSLCPVCGGLPFNPRPTSLLASISFQPPNPSLNILQTGLQTFGINTGNVGQGSYSSTIPTSPSPESFAGFGEIGVFMGSPCDVCNPEDLPPNYEYPHSPGFNPSTSNGTWNPEPMKSFEVLDPIILSYSQQLIDLEKQLGGGDQIINIHQNKVETIGLVMNDMPTFRIDPIGKLRIKGVHVALQGLYETYRPTPYVEQVDVDNVPGGDYNLNVCNKFKLIVGAKGINIKTFGPIDMYGSIVNITGEQVNISSMNEINIDGGERLSLRARKIALVPVEHRPVVIEGSNHITRNLVVKGKSMLEGEVGLLHMTIPGAWYETLPGGIDGHTHMFEMVAASLAESTDEVHQIMIEKNINSKQSFSTIENPEGTTETSETSE
jgi:hypothetical protein